MTINLDQYTNTLNVTDTATNPDLNVTTKGTGNVNLGTGNGTQFRVESSGSTATDFVMVGGSSTGRPFIRSASASGNIDLAISSQGTGAVKLYTNFVGQEQFRVSHTASAVNYIQATGSATGVGVTLSAQGSDSNIQFYYVSKGTFPHSFLNSAGNEQFRVASTASAVNYVNITGAATGSDPTISVQGSDTNINFAFVSKGSSIYTFASQGGSNRQFRIDGTSASVNYFNVSGSGTGFGPVLSALGSDTNIPLVVQPKGTGALQAQQTDSTATGGNARGANAVDWQTSRSAGSSVASGANSVVGGGGSNGASGQYSGVLSGVNSNSTGFATVISGGWNNSATGGQSVLSGGYSNTSGGAFNFIGGGASNSGTANSAVTTQSATMNGTTAVTLSASNANIKVGQLITGTSITTFSYVAAISGTSLTLSQAASGSSTSTLSFYTPHGIVVGGGNNTATGSYSFIGGGGDAGTAGNRNVASGDWSTVSGGMKNTASGNHSSVSGGYGSTTSGVASFIGGGGLYGEFSSGATAPNTASGGSSSIVGGWNNTATSGGSSVLGSVESQSNALYAAVVGGSYGTARAIIGNLVFPANNNPIGARGNAQAALLVLGVQTTDATSTVLRTNTSAATTNNQVIMPNNSAYTFRGEIVSGVTGGGDSKSWTIEGLIKRGANAASTTLVGSTVTSMYADVGAVTWTIALSADTTNGGLAVTFTGQASTTIRTVCQIRTTEMTY
jgi:hypothetical protein